MNLGERALQMLKKYIAVTVTGALALLALWIFFRYGIGIVMPFLLAGGLSLFLSGISDGIALRTHLPKRLVAVAVLLLTLLLFAGIAWISVRRLYREMEGILRVFSENPEKIEEIIQQTVEYISEIAKKIPGLSAFLPAEDGVSEAEVLRETITEMMQNGANQIAAELPSVIMRSVSLAPKVLLFLFVFLFSAFYFCADGARIEQGIRKLLPQSAGERLPALRVRIAGILRRYLRVYLVLFFITFLELFIGLLLLQRPYAFLSALLISALDILPVFGVGTALVPWAIVLFLTNESRVAIGLLILWGVLTIVRQIIEPRLIGNSFGMHPLFALFALYAGLRLFGVPGLILGPAVAVLLKLILSEFFRRNEDLREDEARSADV